MIEKLMAHKHIFWPCAFAALGVFWVKGGNFDALWMQRWCVVLVCMSAVLAYQVGKHCAWGYAPFVFTTLFSGIIPSFWFQRYDQAFMENILSSAHRALEKDDIWAVQSVARQDTTRAAFVFLLLFISLRSLHRVTLHHLKLALGLCGMGFAALVVMTYHWASPKDWVPYFDNPSMGACFIVLSLFALDGAMARQCTKPARIMVWLVGIAAVLMTRTSAPLLALAGGGMASYVARYFHEMDREFERPRWGVLVLGVLLMAALPFGVGYYLQGENLWFSNSRFDMWRWYLEFWDRQDLFTHWFGLGLGSTRAFMPLAEVEHGMDTGWFFWLHNDWLQIFVEQGYVGFAALLVAVGTLLYRVKNTPCVVAFLGAFGAVMLVNFPLHWPVHALLFITVVAPATQIETIYRSQR